MNWAKGWVRGTLALGAVLPGAAAFAEDGGLNTTALLNGVVGTIVYGLIGVALTMIGYKIFEFMMPFSVRHELEEDHNMSVGIVLAAMILGISIIVAATISS
ncbi:MAG: DUF350 domain-containing protein [Deltaproteobacteria bacterium]|nr:MAG: DUF350 domain-containing protein [Deltaproteobacteria bacterium]